MNVSDQPYLQPIYHRRNIPQFALNRSRPGRFGKQENLSDRVDARAIASAKKSEDI